MLLLSCYKRRVRKCSFRDGDLDGDYNDTGDDILYYTNDANMNVTGLIDAETGNIVERYEYTAYGQRTVLDADFTADADNASDFDNRILYCGYRRLADRDELGRLVLSHVPCI